MSYYVGIDIGGTFTDAVLLDDQGTARLLKTPTTLEDPAQGVNNALALAEAELGLPTGSLLSQVRYFGLGTTVATNALIERKGVRTGVITTAGFRDTLLIQRGMGHWVGKEMHEIVHFSQRRNQTPIVPRERIAEVTERVDYKGAVVAPLDDDSVRRAVTQLLDHGVEAIAVCLLWSFRNPQHEQRVADIVREMAPEVYLTVSHELAPVLGEYERTATTAVNAYLGPHVQRYMTSLTRSLRDRGMTGSLRILDSGGGVITPEQCGRSAVSILTSGPTGGVLASAKLAEQLGTPNVLTTDMGGTSFDVGMIIEHEPVVSAGQLVNGYHVLKPAVEVTAIGAGGGSIAQVIDGQLLVGPESAGSVPGPACYRRGGVRPTVTDADVVLGIIDPDYFLGGTFPLDREAAARAIQDHVATPLGVSLEEAAAGIKEIADHRMADILDTLSVGRGHDPRDFVIFAYGGAGGAHCHAFAAELGVRSVIVPSTATAHSAFGAVMSDLHVARELSDPLHCANWEAAPEVLDGGRMTANLARLEEQVVTELVDSGASADAIHVNRYAEIKFRMQAKSLSVAVPPGEVTRDSLVELLAQFLSQFTETYGSEAVFLGAGVEIASLRVQGRGELDRPRIQQVQSGGTVAGHEPPSSRRVYIGREAGWVDAEVLRGASLKEGDVIEGPAVIEHPGTTIFVGQGQTARIDRMDNTVITTSTSGA